MLNNNINDLKEAYNNYQKGKYTFGRFGTSEQIKNAFMDGKIFVLKSSNRALVGLILILVYVILVFTFIGEEYFLLVLIITGTIFGIASIFIVILIISFKRYFVVIGPSGIYYRKVVKIRSFQWNEMTITEGYVQKTRGTRRTPPVTTAIVEMNLPEGKKVKFVSNRYKSKEFEKSVKRRMFISLFQIYYELGKNSN
ncbi:MAG: hypothetical protein ACFE9S_08865 [Candidatus Hermodarchaeota archaeon]